MRDLKSMLSTIAISALFVFAIMSFIIIAQSDNEVTNSITNNSLISSTYSDLETDLKSAGGSAENSANTFGNTTPTQQYGELEVNSIISPTRTARTIIFGFWNILIKLPMQVLGVPEAVASIISAVFIILLIIAVWAVWKGVVS